MFALCIDNFGIKYNNVNDLQHLLTALKQNYEITIDMEGKNFCGLTLEWNYTDGHVDISMPGYIAKKLKKFRHPTPSKPQYAPHKWLKPAYGKQLQLAPPQIQLPLLIHNKRNESNQFAAPSFITHARSIQQSSLPLTK